jgi:hypothetical protein
MGRPDQGERRVDGLTRGDDLPKRARTVYVTVHGQALAPVWRGVNEWDP